ncbi:MAG TPA: iron-sulfur cluster repair di-iron protein [Bryobacteraceae bacterium]|jgi:regulator of cell morphogenesis and NO signaling|nr:iron-sulfur cluster repair di-iron protein [Bryobacteraceae bacterium]
MNPIATQTIGEIAARSMAAVRIFEEHGIDYCCGGQRSLDEVCREKGIDADALVAETEAAGEAGQESEKDWSSAPLKELIDHIVEAHHGYLRREFPHLGRRLASVLQAHGKLHGDTLGPLANVFGSLRAELEMHMRKEEMILFPFIARAEQSSLAGLPWTPPPFGTVGNPIEVMEHEHDSAGRALEQMRRLTNQYTLPEDACNTYRALYEGLAALERDLHVHIHLENNVLFPRAIAMERPDTGAKPRP